MSSSFTIAEVGDAAAPRLATLHAALFPDAPWSAADFAQMLAVKGTCAAIATDHDRDIGLLLLRCLYEAAEILTVGIVPSHRKRGLGGNVIDFAIDVTTKNKATELFLEVAEDNTAALALYTAKGFTPISRRPGYYQHRGHGVAALVMRLHIVEY